MMNRINKFSAVLTAAILCAGVVACSPKPPAPVPVFPPFKNLSVEQYNGIAAKLRAKGVVVIKQQSSVQMVLMARKLFYRNTLRIQPAQQSTLDDIATLVKHAPTSKIRVVGFSNYIPKVKAQYAQSHKMAATVAGQLWQRGVPVKQRLIILAKANTQPVSGSLTAKGNAQNERVEVLIN